VAGEIRQYDVNGSTWYAVIVRASDGYWLNGSTFEDPVVANWTSYARALTQKSTTGAYYGDFPAIAAGLYDVVIYRQAGGSPAASDGPPVAVPTIDWKGSSEATLSETAAIRTGTAQAGTLAGITLDAGASSVDNHYLGLLLRLTGGTGAGQCRTISGYTGSTKVVGLEFPWTTTPDNTTTFAILPRSGPSSYSSGLDVAVGSAVDVEFIDDGAISASVLSIDAKESIATYVWAHVVRTLTAGTNIVLVKGTGVTGFTDLDAAGVRTAVGLASANLDTQLAAIKSDSAAILDDTGTSGVLVATAAAQRIADVTLRRDQDSVESSSDGDTLTKDSLYGFLQRSFQSVVVGSTQTVYKRDGSTVLGTWTLTTDDAADPIVGSA